MSQLKNVRDAMLGGVADTVGNGKAGITVRRSFFYRNGMTADRFATQVNAALAKAHVPLTVKDFGEKYAYFKGGQTVAQGSHWWAVLG